MDNFFESNTIKLETNISTIDQLKTILYLIDAFSELTINANSKTINIKYNDQESNFKVLTGNQILFTENFAEKTVIKILEYFKD